MNGEWVWNILWLVVGIGIIIGGVVLGEEVLFFSGIFVTLLRLRIIHYDLKEGL